jgi:malate dehydrogenase (quinone)
MQHVTPPADAVLVGGGAMSATVGALLKELEPGWSIEVFERLQDVALESSHVLNNAGTGHAAFCELNYTPERLDGSVDVSKALKINESFEVSRQFWAYLQQQGHFAAPREFITAVPHISFVRGDQDVAFLRKRCEALCGHPLFEGMQYSQDRGEMAEWMPLVMAGRDPAEPAAATRTTHGTDVNFGALTRGLFRAMTRAGGVRVHLQHEVRSLERLPDGGWQVTVRDLAAGGSQRIRARFVFLGAGGRSLPLLLGSGIPEARGYGGFPVSGMWLMCLNAEVIARHHAKVYGKAKVGAPPMSVPHLDTRSIDGQKGLQFGTEVVNSADGTLSALLGASPGASTSVAIVLELLARCFPQRLSSDAWQAKLRQMIPTFGQSLAGDRELSRRIRRETSDVLGLAG